MKDDIRPSAPFALLDMILGTWTTQTLSTAAELEIADVLKSGPLSAGEVAERTKTHPDIMYRILRTLASLGVLEQSNDKRFALTEMGQLMRSDAPGSLRAMALMCGSSWHHKAWEVLAECARTGVAFGAPLAFGTSLWDYFDKHKQHFDVFNDAMTGASTNMHAMAVEAYDFAGIERLVDVGGGHGRLLGMILQKYPTMRGVLFDRPSLADGARRELTKLGVADRCEFVGGNFLASVPGGADAYIMSHVLHDWADDRALLILKNCRSAIKEGGKLLVVDAVIKPGNEPDWGKLMDLEMMLLYGGRDRTEEELASMFRQAGFKLNRVIPTRSQTSIVEGIAV
jgi:hypothetical protein